MLKNQCASWSCCTSVIPSLSWALAYLTRMAFHLISQPELGPQRLYKTMNAANSTSFRKAPLGCHLLPKPFLIPTHSSKLPAWLGSPLLLGHIILCPSWSPVLTKTAVESCLMSVSPLHRDLWGWDVYSPLYPWHPSTEPGTRFAFSNCFGIPWPILPPQIPGSTTLYKMNTRQESQKIRPLPILDRKLPASMTCIITYAPRGSSFHRRSFLPTLQARWALEATGRNFNSSAAF